jgi:RNase P subunit RPR2
MYGQLASSPARRVLSTSRCGRCLGPNKVQRITPSRTGFEHWTLRCTKCGSIHQIQIVRNPSKSDPADWFDSPLNTHS